MPRTAARLRWWLGFTAAVLMVALAATGRAGGGRPVIEDWLVNVSIDVDDGVFVQERVAVSPGVRGVPSFTRRLATDLGVPQGLQLVPFDALYYTLAPFELRKVGDFSAYDVSLVSPAGGVTLSGVVWYTHDVALQPGDAFTWRVVIGDPSLDAERVRVRIEGALLESPQCTASGTQCRVEQQETFLDLIVDDLPAGGVVTLSATVMRGAPPADNDLVLDVEYGSIDPANLRVNTSVVAAVVSVLGLAVGVVAGGSVRSGSRPALARRTNDVSVTRPPTLPALYQPWHGAVARSMRSSDERIVDVWLATVAANGIFQPGLRRWTWAKGPAFDRLPPHLGKRIDAWLVDGEVVPGVRHRRGHALWRAINRDVERSIRRQRWWTLFTGRAGRRTALAIGACVVVMASTVVFSVISLWSSDWFVGAAMVFGVPTLVACCAAIWIHSDESAELTALRADLDELREALRHSDAHVVEQAFDDGMLAQLSAWALALGVPDAWDAAIRSSGLSADEQRSGASPLLPHVVGAAWATTRFATYGSFDPDGDTPRPYGQVVDANDRPSSA